MSTEFVLVRHATCALTASTLLGRCIDAPLDDLGRHQAAAVALHLGTRAAALLQSSPRLRARQTATPLAARLGLPLLSAAALDEIDFGRWAGRSFTELRSDDTWQRWNQERCVARTPLGESMQQIQRRIVMHLTALAARFTDQRIIIVTHAEIIRAALLHYSCLDCNAYSLVEVSPASVSTLELSQRGGRVRSVNECVSA